MQNIQCYSSRFRNNLFVVSMKCYLKAIYVCVYIYIERVCLCVMVSVMCVCVCVCICVYIYIYIYQKAGYVRLDFRVDPDNKRWKLR